MAWVEELKPIMREMGYDPEKLWAEMLSEKPSTFGDKFLREKYPDIWAVWKAHYLIVHGEKLS
jgi:hypothetical protein